MSKELGVPVQVVNQEGGGGVTGHMFAARAKPDGYTLCLVTQELSTFKKRGLAPVGPSDFQAIIQINQDPAGLIVQANAPWDTAKELLEYIKNNPGELSFSGTATGGIWDLCRIGMLHSYGIPPNATKWIPTTGAAQAITELLGGHVDAITCSLGEVRTQIESGTLKALAVMSDERSSLFPDVMTLKEQGINWSGGTWRGIAAPKNTPEEIIMYIHDVIYGIIQTQEWIDFMNKNGFGTAYKGPQEFQQFMIAQEEIWSDILEIGGYM